MSLDWRLLVERAIEVRQRGYAPYSGFLVGAALQSATGEIFVGCNVENASYGLSLCAERSALGQAVAAGHRAFRALAVCGPHRIAPCGACRQCLIEFGASIPVYCVGADDPGQGWETTSGELLPGPFTSAALQRR